MQIGIRTIAQVTFSFKCKYTINMFPHLRNKTIPKSFPSLPLLSNSHSYSRYQGFLFDMENAETAEN